MLPFPKFKLEIINVLDAFLTSNLPFIHYKIGGRVDKNFLLATLYLFQPIQSIFKIESLTMY